MPVALNKHLNLIQNEFKRAERTARRGYKLFHYDAEDADELLEPWIQSREFLRDGRIRQAVDI